MASTEATGTPPPSSPRDRLLTKAVDHVAAHGVSDLSLRALAGALGTSHRMLLYHFGSREGLLVAVVEAVEARQRAVSLGLAADATDDAAAGAGAGATDDATATDARAAGPLASAPGEAIRRMWRDVSDPKHWPHERLFFELYGQALQGRPGVEGLLDGIVTSWLDPMAAAAEALGFPPGEARAEARLGIAVVRGLLLDLLATGDREGVDAAMGRWITSFEARLPALRTAPPPPAAAAPPARRATPLRPR
jgi:AcrR family transcriptional regulator